MRNRRIAASLLCAALMSAGAWLVPGAATASTTVRPAIAGTCDDLTHDMWLGQNSNWQYEIVIDAEQSCPELHVYVYRNGVVAASVQSGTGIMTWEHVCNGTAETTWSDSLGDSVTAACG